MATPLASLPPNPIMTTLESFLYTNALTAALVAAVCLAVLTNHYARRLRPPRTVTRWDLLVALLILLDAIGYLLMARTHETNLLSVAWSSSALSLVNVPLVLVLKTWFRRKSQEPISGLRFYGWQLVLSATIFAATFWVFRSLLVSLAQ